MDGSLKSIISTKTAPSAGSIPLSQATVANNTVYVSGCLGTSVATGQLIGGAKEQTEVALENLQNVLQAAGSNLKNVLKTTVYIQDFKDFAIINEAYKNAFVSNFPARTCIQVAKLPFGALVEIEAIAIGQVTIKSKL